MANLNGRWAEKIRRVHKNQAVNLLQIPIHGQIDPAFLGSYAVKFNGSRVTGGFEAGGGHINKKNFIKANAPKFLQSKPGILL